MINEKGIDYLRKIANDDSEAFRSFYDLNYTKIYRIIHYYVNKNEIIEEVVSDVFFTIWDKRKSLGCKIVDINSYLFIIARNKALDYLKKTKNSLILEELPIGLISKDDAPDTSLINKELEIQVKEAIEKLPYNCKLIFLMAREEGLKYKEIASILGISEKTVNAQMVIAIRKLSASLGRACKSK